MKVAIAHEWLTRFAGSESVVERFLSAYPDATIYAGVVDESEVSRKWPGAEVRPLLPSSLPGITSHWQRYAPAILAAWRSVRIEADLLLVSSHFAAHQAARSFNGPKLVYYHTPMRIAWRLQDESGRVPKALRPAMRMGAGMLRHYDHRASSHGALSVANSRAVQRLLHEAYGFRSEVLAPPVRTGAFSGLGNWKDGQYFLVLGRQVAYKRIDLAVKVCSSAGWPLVVAGDGPLAQQLRGMAGPLVRFESGVSDERVRELLTGARALLFPGEEDFGIVPAECLAAGVPVIAYGRGGVLDYLRDRCNSVLFTDQSVEGLRDAVRRFESSFETEAAQLEQSVKHLAVDRFDAGFRSLVERIMRGG